MEGGRMGEIMDGKKLASEVKEKVRRRIKELGIEPGLAVISVGENDASEVYIRQKKKAAESVGIRLMRYHFDTATTSLIIEKIQKLNSMNSVNGILVQLPLPQGIDVNAVMESIRVDKDVDGFHPINFGRLLLGKDGLSPCTPLGILHMLNYYDIPLQGAEAVIVNHSNVVGKPLALMLLNRNTTVTICHVFTKNLREHTRKADIVITAAGVPGLIKSDMIKRNAVVIDVSMNRVGGKLCGDVEFEAVRDRASLITPVPGGVGPMTVAMLMFNTLKATEMQGKHKMLGESIQDHGRKS